MAAIPQPVTRIRDQHDVDWDTFVGVNLFPKYNPLSGKFEGAEAGVGAPIVWDEDTNYVNPHIVEKGVRIIGNSLFGPNNTAGRAVYPIQVTPATDPNNPDYQNGIWGTSQVDSLRTITTTDDSSISWQDYFAGFRGQVDINITDPTDLRYGRPSGILGIVTEAPGSLGGVDNTYYREHYGTFGYVRLSSTVAKSMGSGVRGDSYIPAGVYTHAKQAYGLMGVAKANFVTGGATLSTTAGNFISGVFNSDPSSIGGIDTDVGMLALGYTPPKVVPEFYGHRTTISNTGYQVGGLWGHRFTYTSEGAGAHGGYVAPIFHGIENIQFHGALLLEGWKDGYALKSDGGTVDITTGAPTNKGVIIRKVEDQEVSLLQILDENNGVMVDWDYSGFLTTPGIWSTSNVLVDGNFFFLGLNKYATAADPLPTSTSFLQYAYAWDGSSGDNISGVTGLITRMLSATPDDSQFEIRHANFLFVKVHGINNIWEQCGQLVASRSGSTVDDQSQDTLRIQPVTVINPTTGKYRGLACYPFGATNTTVPTTYTDKNAYLFVSTPTIGGHAVNKTYVDTALASFSGFSGGTVTGQIIDTYNGSASNNNTQDVFSSRPTVVTSFYRGFSQYQVGDSVPRWSTNYNGDGVYRVNAGSSDPVYPINVVNKSTGAQITYLYVDGNGTWSVGGSNSKTFFMNSKLNCTVDLVVDGNATFNGLFTKGATNNSSSGSPLGQRIDNTYTWAWNGGTPVSSQLQIVLQKLDTTSAGVQYFVSLGGTIVYSVTPNGFVVGSQNMPPTGAMFSVDGNTKVTVLSRLTTTERDAIAILPEGGEIYNKSLKKKQFWNGTAWETITSA